MEDAPKEAEEKEKICLRCFKMATKNSFRMRGGLLITLVQKTQLLNENLIAEFNKDAAKFLKRRKKV